jgi:capsular polysaccharide transport system permease protein
MAERKRMAERMEQLKNDKLRRQLEQMEADAENEVREAEAAAAAAQGDGADKGPRVPQPVPHAHTRPRHIMALASFVILVVAPVLVAGWYLWTRAQDRYVSYAGFSVRTEEIGSAFDLLGGVAEISGSSSSDTDILYKFIQSPELVAAVDAALDLRDTWGRPGRLWRDDTHDPVFAYNPEGALGGLLFGTPSEPSRGSIEDLTAHWTRMVKVYSDSGTGLIDLEVQAFTPEEARAIAQLVYDQSSAMINRLAASAREDATRYARGERDQAVERLKVAREALTAFRLQTGIVDPSVTIQEQMGLLTPLQAQLAQTLIDLDVQRQTAAANDPRITQLERRVEVIEERIAAERRKQGLNSDQAPGASAGNEVSFAVNLAEYERLSVDLEFAQQAYTAALVAFDTATAEAQRQSRYLAAHVNPTLPESPTQPRRGTLLGLTALFAFLVWATLVLAAYALRDRR